MVYVNSISKHFFRSTLFLLIIVSQFIACKSKSIEEENLQYYHSLNLNFSISVPLGWKIFETGESVLLSNNVSVFLLPEDERIIQNDEFLVSVSVLERDEIINFIDKIPLKTSEALKEIIDLSELNNFNDYATQDTELLSMYQDLLLEPPTEDTKFIAWKDRLLIGEDSINSKGEYIFYLFKQVQNNIVAVLTIEFNTDSKYAKFQDFFTLADSIELDYNSGG